MDHTFPDAQMNRMTVTVQDLEAKILTLIDLARRGEEMLNRKGRPWTGSRVLPRPRLPRQGKRIKMGAPGAAARHLHPEITPSILMRLPWLPRIGARFIETHEINLGRCRTGCD